MAALFSPGVATALTVDIQGVHLEPAMEGASCIDIAGDYPGVRIEADQPGQAARVCYSAARIDLISIANATLIATAPAKKEILIRFEHGFPAGVNGKVTARAKLRGFFATESGVGVPTGDQLSLRAFFSQGKAEDLVSEPFDFTVGEELESALFEHSAKKQYLVAGPRSLKGMFKITFKSPGHKLTFPDKCLISLDTGSTFADKLESMELEGEAPQLPGEGEAAPPPAGGAAPEGGAPPLEPLVPEAPKQKAAPKPTPPSSPPALEPPSGSAAPR
jgi:hypothetical protein